MVYLSSSDQKGFDRSRPRGICPLRSTAWALRSSAGPCRKPRGGASTTARRPAGRVTTVGSVGCGRNGGMELSVKNSLYLTNTLRWHLEGTCKTSFFLEGPPRCHVSQREDRWEAFWLFISGTNLKRVPKVLISTEARCRPIWHGAAFLGETIISQQPAVRPSQPAS